MDDTFTRLKRDDIADFIDDSRKKKKNKKNHVRDKVEENFPELVGKTIRRNNRTYNAIDYLLEDLESYG